MAKIRRWVIKAGSVMVCNGGPLLMRAWMQQLYELRTKHNIEVIWVTSGAIAWAADRTKNIKSSPGTKPSRKRSLPEKQALSAIGQPLIMDQYNLALQSTGLLGAQVLLTASDMRDKTHRENLKNTLRELLKIKVIPILNENDAVATDEIQFGDNDTLAAKVAIMMSAERLILMTDVEGLYNKNPAQHKDAQLIQNVKKVTSRELNMADKNTASKIGRGGMYSKLKAAKSANSQGIVTHLVRGDVPKNLISIAKNISIGTKIGV